MVKEGILDSSGCGKKYHRLSSLTHLYFLTVLEAESLRSGCQHGGFLVRCPFLACRWPLSCCVRICAVCSLFFVQMQREGGREGGRKREEREHFLVSFLIFIYFLFGCIESQLWHVRSSLQDLSLWHVVFSPVVVQAQ